MNTKQDSNFFAGLAASLVLSTLIVVFAQSIGERAAQERITDPATYGQSA
jgi:hypothetical protein